jgi:hypothetical protein
MCSARIRRIGGDAVDLEAKLEREAEERHGEKFRVRVCVLRVSVLKSEV